MVSTTGMPVSLKAELWFPIPGQQGHGARIIHVATVRCRRDAKRTRLITLRIRQMQLITNP